jgi:hypothetical protein
LFAFWSIKSKKTDLNADGNITLPEMQKYIFEHVPNLTKGKQQPTNRAENINNNFKIW